MNIAFAYDCIYPFSHGGGEKRIWELARRLAARGHRVSILGQKWWEGDDTLVREGVRIVGVAPFRPLFNAAGHRSFSQPVFYAWHLFRYLRTHSFDVMECSNFPYLSCFAARLAQPRTPIVVCWLEIRGLRGWLRYNGITGVFAAVLETICLRLSGFNTANSSVTTSRFPPDRPIRIIPNGVDYRFFEAARKPSSPFAILNVGRLVPHKRLDMLVDAVARLREEFPSVSLTLVGDGSAKAALVEQVSRLGLESCVKIVDTHPSDDEVMAEYGRASVFVLPSEQEGFGIVLVEAMAAALPCLVRIAPDSASSGLIDQGKTGFGFRSLPELVESLRWVFLHPDQASAIGRNAREAARVYDWERITDITESFLAEAFSSRSPR